MKLPLIKKKKKKKKLGSYRIILYFLWRVGYEFAGCGGIWLNMMMMMLLMNGILVTSLVIWHMVYLRTLFDICGLCWIWFSQGFYYLCSWSGLGNTSPTEAMRLFVKILEVHAIKIFRGVFL